MATLEDINAIARKYGKPTISAGGEPSATSTISRRDRLIQSGRLKTEPEPSGGIVKDISDRVEELKTSYRANEAREQTPFETGVQYAGTAIGAAGDVVADLAMSQAKAMTPDFVERKVSSLVRKGAENVMKDPLIAKAKGAYDELSERTKRNVRAATNIVSAVPAGKGAQGGFKAFEKTAGDVIDTIARPSARTAAELKDLVAKGELGNRKMAAYDPVTLKKDPVAQEAIKQGLSDSDVAIIKSMSQSDKAKARSMVEIAEKAQANKRSIERPYDKVGETVLEPAKVVSNQLQTAAKELDEVSKSLIGKKPEGMGTILGSVENDIDNIGASLFPDGSINFKGSMFEDIGSNERIINNVYRRILEADDAYDLHKIKKYIDTNVSYGKQAEGLTGEAERLLKGWRRNIDAALDSQFSDYNRVNTILSETIGQLGELHSILGKNFNMNMPLSEIKAGQVSSRILTNSPNRGEIIRILDNLQKTAKKYGYKSDEDLINQIIFADLLEEVYGTQATRSLAGNLDRSMEALTMTKELASKGTMVDKGINLTKQGYKFIRGMNQDAKVEALKRLLDY